MAVEGPEAAARDEGDWATRGENAACITSVDTQITLMSPAASMGQETFSSDEYEETRAVDLAVLGDACPICLQTLENPVMVAICHHVYCLECLTTWAHSLALHGVEAPTCPLCKNPFQDVYAHVRDETDYEVLSFQGQCVRQYGRRRRQSDAIDSHERLRRRSLVYRRHMRLARVAGKQVDDCVPFPKMRKLKGEYESWVKDELRACIGREIDVTVLVAIIQCCLDKIAQCGPTKCYNELQTALMPFLYEDAGQFVRELAFFLGSRLNITAYDAAVEYRCEKAVECSNALCCGS